MSITVNSLSYIHPDGEMLFENIHLHLAPGQKASLVGDNGTGKSTLLRIVAGQLPPATGDINLSEEAYYVPQHVGQFDHFTVAEALGIAGKLRALRAIFAGETDELHFAELADDWEIEDKAADALAVWHLQHINLSQPMQMLSGGEKTKVFLAGVNLRDPAIVLLDEPTNHLDGAGRQVLYDLISKSKRTLLVVSHDKTLLNLVDQTLELTQNGVEAFGGNYDFYRAQRDIKLQALQTQLGEHEKSLKQARQKARDLAEQRQKQESRGQKQGQTGSLPRIIAGGRKHQAEQTAAKLKHAQNEKLSTLAGHMQEVRAQIRQDTPLRIDLRKSDLHAGKMLVEAVEINFSFGQKTVWENAWSLMIRSGERVRISGANGSGKSTLLKVLLGELLPTTGTLFRNEFKTAYIDQEYSMIDNHLTVFEQIQKHNTRLLSESELKTMLHAHQFSRTSWDLKCAGLSGGEKMKLALCCIAADNHVPDMLVLDEPTNNLDLKSQEILTEAVRNFGGALVVVTHDQHFAAEIGAEREIAL